MAFGSVSDILLKITGDPSDASEAIAELAGELAVFSKQEAEAEADVATSEAMDKLRLLRERLEAVDLTNAEPEVKAKVAIALAELEIVESKMSDLDGETATVDVDVRRGTLERLGAVSTRVLGLTRNVRGLSDSGEGLGASFSNIGTVLGPFTARLGELGPILAALSPLIVSIGGAIVALVASLGAAVAGLGALAVAFGGVLAVGIGFGIAAIARFKDEADTAGTPANALKTAFQGIGDAAKKLLPAVDPVFKAMAAGLTALRPLIGFLAPAFRQFGEAAAGSVKSFVDVLSSPAIATGIASLVSLAGGALQPLAVISAQLFRIFLNIANAALPFLVSGLQSVADALTSIGDSTSNIGQLRGQIGGLVGILGEWLALIGAVSKALLGIFTASAGPGTQLVRFLTEGANALADWANSAKGQEQIKSFFADTLPLVEQLAGLVAHLVVIFTEVGQALAPVLTPLVAVFNVLLGLIQQFMGAFLAIPAPARTAIVAVIAIIVALLTGVGEVTAAILIVVGAIALISVALKAIGGAATAAFNAMVSAATTAWAAVKSALSGPIQFILHLPAGIVGEARALWGTVSGAIKAAISFVFNVPRAALGLARSLWGSVRGTISAAISFAFSVPRTALGLARGLWSAVKGVISAGITFAIHLPGAGSLVGAAHAIWEAVKDALPDITIHIHIPTPSIPHIPGTAVGGRNLPAGVRLVGEEGPELLNLPKGGDIFTARDTRNILEKLARGSNLAGIRALSNMPTTSIGPAPQQINNFDIHTRGIGMPDPRLLLAQLDTIIRTRGGFGS